MARGGRILSSLARTGLQRLLTERGGGASMAMSTVRPPTTGAWQTLPSSSASFLRSGGAATLRFFSPPPPPPPPPLPAAAAQEEDQEESKPSTPPRAANPSPAEPPPSPHGRAPTAATAAVFAEMARPASCTRVDLATKLLDADHAMSTPTYTREYLESIKPTHLKPESFRQKLAHAGIQLVRFAFDAVTLYNPKGPNPESRWLRRMLFLETVAGVPGMVGGSLRHLRSLRMLRYDGGRINTLLDESENERMHLMTFLELGEKKGPLFRAAVVVAQGVMWNFFFLLYLASPNTAHSFVGFLEEEAVKTYTHALEEIDAGRLWPVDGPVKPPAIAVAYWKLPAETATMRDVILAIRADEAAHAHVNHTFSLIDEDAPNPFSAAVRSKQGGEGGGVVVAAGVGGHGCSAATLAEAEAEVVAEAEEGEKKEEEKKV